MVMVGVVLGCGVWVGKGLGVREGSGVMLAVRAGAAEAVIKPT